MNLRKVYFKATWNNLIDLFERFGAPPPEGSEERIRRGVTLVMGLTTFLAGVLWGVLYISFGETYAGYIPLLYSGLCILNLILLYLHKNPKVYSFLQISLILLLPFFLMFALGGFVNSSAVILWSILAPMAALLIFGRRSALFWFVAYVILGIISGVLESSAPMTNNLPLSIKIFFFVLNISAPTLSAFLLLYYFVGEKNLAYQLLGIEQEKSERLLLNVLPKEIAHLLKDNNQTIAEHFDEVTVLFADVVGFTPLSETLSPRETVDILNEIFSHFDKLADKYAVEKIRTIGDGYMVAAGVPVPRPDHALTISKMALEMNEYMQDHQNGNFPLKIRVGINSGSAVAGIVGTTKFHYDLWGDAVNTAARMESQGVPGKIQIARGTYERIKDQLNCVSRGKSKIKGKGEMETWFLESAEISG